MMKLPCYSDMEDLFVAIFTVDNGYVNSKAFSGQLCDGDSRTYSVTITAGYRLSVS